jgi:radical SAM superfamily enzyme YgiQ (UPF0313 family)
VKKRPPEYRRDILRAERGTIFKRGATLRVALGYANSYEVAISNLGFQTVYRLFNEEEEVDCERFFFEKGLKQEACHTLESGSPLGSFDLVTFSVSYELDLVNLLRVLKIADLPLFAADRSGGSHPLLMAGGIAPTLNPEPFAPFFDLIFIGEAEAFVGDFVRVVRERSGKDREGLLSELSRLEGVYVPKFYTAEYDREGRQTSFKATNGAPERVRRSIHREVERSPAYSLVISKLGHFRETLLVEVGRGCPHRCKFCAACAAYSPTRFSSLEAIWETIEAHKVGATKVGLVGTLLSDYPHLTPLCRRIVESRLGLGLSSFRADKVNAGILESLRNSGERTVTIAPEAGTQRLRFAMGKRIEDREILEGIEIADRVGLHNLRLYFMIGLPGETPEDIEAIVELVRRVKKDHFRGNVRVSVAPFVPKPGTPLMYAPYCRRGELEQRMRILNRHLRSLPGVTVKGQGLRSSEVSAMISLGTRRVGEALGDSVSTGRSIKSALRSRGVKLDTLLYSQRSLQDRLPWDFIEPEVNKKALYGLYERKPINSA